MLRVDFKTWSFISDVLSVCLFSNKMDCSYRRVWECVAMVVVLVCGCMCHVTSHTVLSDVIDDSTETLLRYYYSSAIFKSLKAPGSQLGVCHYHPYILPLWVRKSKR